MNFDYATVDPQGMPNNIYCLAIGKVYTNLGNDIIEIKFEVIDKVKTYKFELDSINQISGVVSYKLSKSK